MLSALRRAHVSQRWSVRRTPGNVREHNGDRHHHHNGGHADKNVAEHPEAGAIGYAILTAHHRPLLDQSSAIRSHLSSTAFVRSAQLRGQADAKNLTQANRRLWIVLSSSVKDETR